MHRAELILDAVKAALTGLVTTGQSVERGRVYPVEKLPGLSIEMGADNPTGESINMAFQDRALEVSITSYVKSLVNTETTSNAIRSEVYAALMSDQQLGLYFVKYIQFSGDEAPQLSGDSDKRVGTQSMNYTIFYRHSLISAEA